MIKPDWDPANTPYDVTSLMHYDSLGFSIDYYGKQRVMMPVDIHHLTAIGQRARLQFTDLKRVNVAYQCIGLYFLKFCIEFKKLVFGDQ